MTRSTRATACAAEGCDRPVPRGQRGRPHIYCSPGCRPSRARHPGGTIVVEVDHEATPDDARPAGRIWIVRLRRNQRTVTIASELGRPSADHLATQIGALLNPHQQAHRGAID